jgi:predicted dehydrogenase
MLNLRFALLGCGRISAKHAQALSKNLPGAELTAVCDTNAEQARKVGEKYNVPWFTDFEEMIRELGTTIDVVNVLTPSGMHAQHAIRVARCGKHVVVEKPMALTLRDADDMIRACDENGVKLFVVKQNRYNYPVQKLREAMEEGRFGKLVLGTVRVRWCRRQDYYDQASWRGTWEQDGGVFANQASHHVDLLEWMMGDVESVQAMSATRLADIETEDTGVVILRFSNGALGVIEATTATRPVDLEGSISVLGEYGTVEIAGFAVNEMKIWNFADKRPADMDVIERYKQNPPDVYGFGHVTYLQNVIESIKVGKPALVDGLEGKRSLELITAIYESIETGKEVFLRFVPRKSRLGSHPA